ncbi:hypothetical protein U472_10470 [Orenia metallireducens]|uniref:Glycosyltransferase 2-like domain-containing protein n=1 Tax=Orenia metallireducens TaxID=1413210 RepID=A0A1C0A849_9FIRM|nr:glycosyltransferase [Orenia metallireducens]OCL26417.1 hypothetical protein U472_10470 [Orenia metallireducens]
MPYYSFVILCYNNWEMSKQAIDTLINSINNKYKAKGIELIIVNNGSTDNTSDGIKKLQRDYTNYSIEIISLNLEENMGYPVGINLGLAKCRGKMVTILNNDLIFPADWFDGLVDILEKKEDIGVAAPYLSYACSSQNVGVKLNSQEEISDFAKEFMKNNKQKISYPLRVIGACLVFKREVIDKIGGNDFWFGIGLCDDDDLSLRTVIAGYKIAITGSSFVYHLGTVTFNQQVHELNCALSSNHPKLSMKWNLQPHGEYQSREDIIDNINYSKDEHYFPTKIREFNGIEPPIIDKNQEERLLLVADWNNHKSKWKEKLISILDNIDQEELYIWIPKGYFLTDQISAEVKEILDSKIVETTKIKFYYQNIAPINLLKFLNSFDTIFTVDNDFVNRYIVYLAEEISIPTK